MYFYFVIFWKVTYQVTYQVRPQLIQKPEPDEAIGPCRQTSSPRRSPSHCDEVYSDNSWRHWLNWYLAVTDTVPPIDDSLAEEWRRMSRWQWCLTIFAECPLVLLTELSVKKRSNGIVDSPLNTFWILPTDPHDFVSPPVTIYAKSVIIRHMLKYRNHSCEPVLDALEK